MKAHTFGQHHILVQFRRKLAALGRFDPGVVVDCGGISIWGISVNGGGILCLHRPSMSRPFSYRWNQMSAIGQPGF